MKHVLTNLLCCFGVGDNLFLCFGDYFDIMKVAVAVLQRRAELKIAGWCLHVYFIIRTDDRNNRCHRLCR